MALFGVSVSLVTIKGEGGFEGTASDTEGFMDMMKGAEGSAACLNMSTNAWHAGSSFTAVWS